MDQPLSIESEYSTPRNAHGFVEAYATLEEQEDLRRKRESEAIGARYAEELSKRGHRSNFSPEYLASLPKSMAEKLRVTPEEEEEVLYIYASTASIQKTADASGVSLDRVRAIVYNPASQSAIAQYRESLRISVIAKIDETQSILLESMQDPRKLNDSSITQLASVFSEISQTQLHLMSAKREAEGPLIALTDPSAIFTGDELEHMAFLRRRITAGAGLMNELSPGQDSMAGHEFVDPEFTPNPHDTTLTIDEVHTVEIPIPDEETPEKDGE